jgi:hypothetical protein
LDGVPADLFTKISGLVSLGYIGGGFDFCNFIADAFVAYLPSHNEILVGNAAFGYSFVYSFSYNVWTRYNVNFTGRVQGTSMPYFFLSTGGGTEIVTIPDAVSGDNRIQLFTRPQIWGSKLPKRIMQLLLHCYVESSATPTQGVPLLACYLLGSNDGTHFKIVAGSEKSAGVQDVLFPYFPTRSFKYYLFAIVGEVGAATVVTGMDIDVEFPWRNRLR